jgi:Neprosin
MPDPVGIQPFAEFLESIETARAAAHLGVPDRRVANEDAFNEMRQHLQRHYAQVQSQHSFVDENGSVFDCIPIEQQPARRGRSEPLPRASDLPSYGTAGSPTDARRAMHVEQLGPNRLDRHGNVMHAPEGTIPMRRLTIENLARFQTLRHFFQKSPFGSGLPPQAGGGSPNPAAAAVAATHRWAHAAQSVNNLGGHSFLNVWDPPIGANQVFSLSQHWYVGGSGAGLQTAEVGWQVFPQLYGNTNPVFFIYWTADDYQTTGCYNLSCSAFVQTNSSWAIGGAISPSSVPGGQQQEIEVSYFLTGGNWWLYVGGGAASNAVGYYPASIYRGGAMATQAASIDYGGEVVGTTSWPPMGSGAFANTGYQHAAYQRNITYFPTGGGAVNAGLTAAAASPQCFTCQVSMFNPPWSETIFFGGPGGTTC